MVGPAALAEFLPERFTSDGSLRLVRTGPPPFGEPFLVETLARCREAAAPSVTLLPGKLIALQPQVERPQLIAHSGRCGSTLLCRLLDSTGSVATFREPDILVDAVRIVPQESAPDGLSAALAQFVWMAQSVHRRALVKLPSHALDLLSAIGSGDRRPIFLVRHPVPVVGRVLSSPPAWLLRDLDSIGVLPFPDAPVRLVGDPEVLHRVVGHWNAFADTLLDRAPEALVVSYDELVEDPNGVTRSCLRYLGIDGSPEGLDEVAARHAKSGDPWVAGGVDGTVDLRPEDIDIVVALTARRRERIEAVLGRTLRA